MSPRNHHSDELSNLLQSDERNEALELTDEGELLEHLSWLQKLQARIMNWIAQRELQRLAREKEEDEKQFVAVLQGFFQEIFPHHDRSTTSKNIDFNLHLLKQMGSSYTDVEYSSLTLVEARNMEEWDRTLHEYVLPEGYGALSDSASTAPLIAHTLQRFLQQSFRDTFDAESEASQLVFGQLQKLLETDPRARLNWHRISGVYEDVNLSVLPSIPVLNLGNKVALRVLLLQGTNQLEISEGAVILELVYSFAELVEQDRPRNELLQMLELFARELRSFALSQESGAETEFEKTFPKKDSASLMQTYLEMDMGRSSLEAIFLANYPAYLDTFIYACLRVDSMPEGAWGEYLQQLQERRDMIAASDIKQKSKPVPALCVDSEHDLYLGYFLRDGHIWLRFFRAPSGTR